MKILLLLNNISEEKLGIVKAGIEKLKSFNLGISVDIRTVVKQFTSVGFSNSTNANGVIVNPYEILAEVKGGYDFAYLIYDWDKVSPKPTNPASSNMQINGVMPMQMPFQWYDKYPEVFAEFTLHELCHMGYFLANAKGVPMADLTHNYDPAFSQKPRTDYYLFLLKTLAPYFAQYIPTPATPTAIIRRQPSTSKETLGVMTATNGAATFSCKTLELPDTGNQPNVSCIPKGTYRVKWTWSLKYLKSTYEIQNVPARSGIRIHSGNYYHDLKGCISLGDGLADINFDGQMDITNTRVTIAAFERFFNKKDFTLVVM